MMTTTDLAHALLSLTEATWKRARSHVCGYQRVRAQLGEHVASWAYSDKGIGPGLRGPCETATELAKWKPTPGDWCRVFIGKQGTGKSVSAARYVADRGGMLISAPGADSWGFGGGETLVTASKVEWLLIDDLGESKTRPGDGNIATLITNRYANAARTVITTVMLPEDIGRRFGDNVLSRVRPHIVKLNLRETEDRRSNVTPIMSLFQRESEIAWYSERVDLVCSGILTGADARASVERFAELTGTALDGDAVAAAVQAARARRTSMEQMAADFLADLDTKPRISVATPRADDDLDEWLAKLETGAS